MCECSGQQVSFNIVEETIASFASMPQTSSAVALWLVELDALIAPFLEKVRFQKKPEISTNGKGIFICHMHFIQNIINFNSQDFPDLFINFLN